MNKEEIKKDIFELEKTLSRIDIERASTNDTELKEAYDKVVEILTKRIEVSKYLLKKAA